ncbi:MAG: hypothetical protein AB1641_28190 [Thermodesulfobacteriota bacterium]
MILSLRLYPPLKFDDGDEFRQVEVEPGTKADALLDRLEGEGVFRSYGRQYLLVLTADRIIRDDYPLEAGQFVKIILSPDGG